MSFTKSVFLAGILAISAFAGMAQDQTTQNPAVKMMVDTWAPSPATIIKLVATTNLVDNPSGKAIGESFDNSLDDGFTTLSYAGCEAMFNSTSPDDKICDYRGEAAEMMRKIWNYAISPDFIKTVDQPQLASAVVEKVGIGRSKLTLTAIQRLYTEPFDPSAALDYQRWRANWCNYMVMGDGKYNAVAENRGDKPTKSECLKDPFVTFMTKHYCAPSTSPTTCDLARVSWAYGFLTRRYMWGGDDAVKSWQNLMNEAAAISKVEFWDVKKTFPTNN